MIIVGPFQLEIFYLPDGTVTDLLPTLRQLLPSALAAAGVAQGVNRRQAAARGTPLPWPWGQAGLQEHCEGVLVWQLDGVRKSRLLSLPQVSRGLPNNSGKPNQGSFLG